jgi:protoporphyrinogen oxidase
MLGITLALRLAESGRRVVLFEASDRLGGLAEPWQLPIPGEADVVWDRHYHVTLSTDAALLALLDELGLRADVRWAPTRTGMVADGRLLPVSGVRDFLKLPHLSPVAKARLGATLLAGSRIKDWHKLENMTAEAWLTTWSGASTFRAFWIPLLRAKLGDAWHETNAAFVWATIQRLASARSTGGLQERFGYVPGGYATVLERATSKLAECGVDLVLGAPVREIHPTSAGLEVRSGERSETVDGVAVTTDAHVAAAMCGSLTPSETEQLLALRYQGVVCASVVLARPIGPYYLTYLFDDAPFTAVVEMSTLVASSELHGRSLVYLPKYVSEGDPMFDEDDAVIEESFLAALDGKYPAFDRSDVLAFRVSRARRVFPIATLGYSHHIPPFDTSTPGLHLVMSAQICNGTLNVNETIELGERAARHLLAQSSPVPSGPPAVSP